MSGGWRTSRVIAVLVFTVVLAVQLVIPTSRLVGFGQAQRFGWQMFSGSEAFPEFVVVTSSGEQNVSIEDYVLRQRVELDLVEALPPHLCLVIADATMVTWDEGSYRC